ALTGAAAVGYNFDMDRFGLRLEVEGGASKAAIKNHTIVDQLLIGAPTSFDAPAAYGAAMITYGMLNAAADVKMGTFSPYLTAGLGFASVDLDNHGVVLTAATLGIAPGFVTAIDNTQEGFAWQIGGGIGYEVSEKVTLDFGYRHFRVQDVELLTLDATTTKDDIVQNTATVGVRLNF
ncbi:MAG: outer membrane protein, partial [Notoacmeibacter sp.]